MTNDTEATPDLDTSPLDDLLGYTLRRAQMRVFQDFSAAMARFGLSPGQFGLMMLIAGNPGRSQSALAGALGLDRSTIVATVDRLEERGLIRRAPAPEDRRSYALMPTAAGQDFLAQIRPHLQRHEDRIAARLSGDERRALMSMLGRLAAE